MSARAEGGPGPSGPAIRRRALVAEDDATAREWLERFLASRGFDVHGFGDGAEAWAALEKRRYDLVLTDLRMPGMDGLELIRRLHAFDPAAVVVVTTAHATIEGTVEALRSGARDYLPKPYSADHLETVLERALRDARASRSAPTGLGAPGPARDRDSIELVVGHGEAMREAVELADRIAPTETMVLLRGETGTGKELLARRIHARSRRRTGPLVRFNFGCISATLADSQLFGTERGAYTSSVRQTAGVLESAEGGSVFLDEVGEIPSDLQAKLLEFLQDRTYRRVGSSAVRRADVRVLFATHRDLEAMVRAGQFRPDLYYRIRQIEIRLPALRDRSEDIPELIRHVLAVASPVLGHQFDDEALALALAYPWPGNIRELEQATIAAAAMGSGGLIRAADLRRALGLDLGRALGGCPAAAAGVPPPDVPLEEVDRWHIQRALEACGGNVSEVARRLGIDRSTIYRKILRKT